MEHWDRDKRLWSFFRAFLSGWLRHKFNFTPEPVRADGPYLVLANHVTDWDPLLVALSFKPHMYFVASEHIFRWGFIWKVINWVLHPIARLKGTTASDTVLTVMRRMKKGASVAIFAEGNRTWDGRTGEILSSTGKLARSCGGALITYRLEGGYFTSPRWAGASIRRGRMRGHAVGIYSREKLRAMTPEQINDLIRRDLFEDAYERQREKPVAFRGRNLAAGLETMLCVCPKCGKIGTLHSSGNRLTCSECGLAAAYNEFGFLSGTDLPFDNIRDWDAWQSERLAERAAAAEHGELLFSDGGVTLDLLLKKHRVRHLGSGTFEFYPDRLVCAGREFPIAGISGMGMHGPLGLSISLNGEHYEVVGRKNVCLRKYMTTFSYLRSGAEYGRAIVV